MKVARVRAFTLIEMMAVVIIIGLLAVAIGPKFFGQVNKAQVTRAQKDIETLTSAVTLYKFNTGQFPSDLQDLLSEPSEVSGWAGPYLNKKGGIKDPWDKRYEYVVPGRDGREFDIWSYGQDGIEGGEGMNADITSWEDE